jgi:hypothetical protein
MDDDVIVRREARVRSSLDVDTAPPGSLSVWCNVVLKPLLMKQVPMRATAAELAETPSGVH